MIWRQSILAVLVGIVVLTAVAFAFEILLRSLTFAKTFGNRATAEIRGEFRGRYMLCHS